MNKDEALQKLNEISDQYKNKYGYLKGGKEYYFTSDTFLINDESPEMETGIRRLHGANVFCITARIVIDMGINNTITYMLDVTKMGDRTVMDFYTPEKLMEAFDKLFKEDCKKVMQMNRRNLVKQIDSLPG